MPPDPRRVRLPRVLSEYVCGRSTLCCRAPFVATVSPQELAGARAALSAVGAPAELIAALPRAPGPESDGSSRLIPTAGACGLLSEVSSCGIHERCGLETLPAVCRTFPRSVVATPDGIEVAFVLSCPTAAAMVAARPEPFSWAECSAAGWAYPASRRTGRRIWLSYGRQVRFAELEVLRERWWALLADAASDPARVLSVVADLTAVPQESEAVPQGHGGPLSVSGLSPDQAERVWGALRRIPGRGGAYVHARASILEALAQPVAAATLASSMGDQAPALACSVALAVQLAGVHVSGSVAQGLVRAGWHALLASALTSALRRTGTFGAGSFGDVLSAVGQVYGEGGLS